MTTSSKKASGSKKMGNGGKKSASAASTKKVDVKGKLARSTVSGKFVVIPKSDGWMVQREGSNRARHYISQVEAVTAATKTARSSKTGVILRGKDGRIRKVSTSRADSRMLDVWKSTRGSNSDSKKR